MKDATVLQRIADGRTDLILNYVERGNAATARDRGGVSLMQWAAYYGDASAVRFLHQQGVPLQDLGFNIGLNGAAFSGFWRLCEYLVEAGADVNRAETDTLETPLHASLCTNDRTARDLVIRLLLAHGADVTRATAHGVSTGGFMRDCRTKGETALHRAAAFGNESTIQMLLEAGARRDAKDMNGDSPLSWASWYIRPDPILRLLCYGEFFIRPERRSHDANLQGEPHR